MAEYTFRASGGPDPASITLDPGVSPPHDLPTMLALRRTASGLLRDAARFATSSAIDIHHGNDTVALATVDRAHLAATSMPEATRRAA